MSRQVSDSVLDAAIRSLLVARAAETAGMPSAAEVRDRVLARQPRQIAIGWRLVPMRQVVVVAALLALAAAIVLVAASSREPMLQGEPSNGRIVVSANPLTVGGGENGDIYLLNEGSTQISPFEPVRIIGSDFDGLAQACPQFSPDGRVLAYAEAQASGIVTTFRGNWPVPERAVVVVAVDASGVPTGPSTRFELERAAGPLTCPEWAQDSRRIAVRLATEIRVIEVASGRVTVIPAAPVPRGQDDIEWSRDGSRIAIAEPGAIRVATIDGDSLVIPVEGEVPDFLGWTSPDGRIVYAATDEPGDSHQLRMVDAGGGNDVALTGLPGESGVTYDYVGVAMAPDGRRVAIATIVFTCRSEGCSGERAPLVVLDLVTLRETQIAVPGELHGVAQWSPDGTRLLLASIDGVLSVGLAPGDSTLHYVTHELNLEWSATEISWQPRFP